MNAIYSHGMTNTAPAGALVILPDGSQACCYRGCGIGRPSRASVPANVAQIIAREPEDTDATPAEE